MPSVGGSRIFPVRQRTRLTQISPRQDPCNTADTRTSVLCVRREDPEGGLHVDPGQVARVELLEGFSLECEQCSGGVADGLPRGVQRLIALLGVSRQPPRTVIAGL